NRRPEDHHREPERDAFAASDTPGEQQQRQARENRTRAPAQRDARGQERFQDLAASLVLDEQRTDDVEHTADHQQAGKEPAHPAPLEPEFVPHTSYNGAVNPNGSEPTACPRFRTFCAKSSSWIRTKRSFCAGRVYPSFAGASGS